MAVNGLHYAEVKEVFKDKKNIKLVCFEFIRKISFYENFKSLEIYLKPKSIFRNKFDKLIRYISKIIWISSQKFLYPFKLWLIFQNDVIFNPSPSFTLFTKLRPMVFGFWDPFVFEHAAFGKNRKNLMINFWYKFSFLSDFIVTQSEANKTYLKNTWKIKDEKIFVIRLGTPDYEEILNKFLTKIPDKNINRLNILQYWPMRKILAPSKQGAINLVSSEFINKSVLFRLHQNIKPNSKIFIVSTQYRIYKGYEALFALFDNLIKKNPQYDFNLILTSELPEKLRNQFTGKYTWAVPKLYEFSRVTNLQHACLYKLSDIALHPSNLEGGPTMYPASEAASLGVPSLTNSGRHTDELIRSDGSYLKDNIADFSAIDITSERIMKILDNEDTAIKNVENISNAKINWKISSQKYCELFESI